MAQGYVILAGVILGGIGLLITTVVSSMNRRRFTNTEPHHTSSPSPHSTPKCVICDNSIESDRKTLRCGHSFHKSCMDDILNDVTEPCKVCPICNTSIS